MTRPDELVEQIVGADDPREMVDRLRLRAVTDAELRAALTAAAAAAADRTEAVSFTGPGCTGPAWIVTDQGDTPTAGLFAYPSPSRRTNLSGACGDESRTDPGVEAELVDADPFATYPPPYRLVAR